MGSKRRVEKLTFVNSPLGPVIGPLVMCGVLIKQDEEHKLIKLKVKDSKLLTPKQRENLFTKIIKAIRKYKVIVIAPKEIDDAVNSDKLNLNWLEAIKSAHIINELRPDIAILDCPSNNTKAYKEYVEKHLKTKVGIRAEHKAESKFPVVAAASIIAKVTRDKEIKKIQSKIKENIGSGYPSDPVTAKFLKENYKRYPIIFRKSWISYKGVLKKKSQRTLTDFSRFKSRALGKKF